MKIIDGMIEELKQESASTRRVLERVPDDRLEFKPHEKSFTMRHLASHIADSLMWAEAICATDRFEFDVERWKPWLADSAAEMVAKFDETLDKAVKAMQPLADEELARTWTMADTKGTVMIEAPRIQILRGFLISHMIHHRAQLGLYFRMNDVPVPAIYGPSADEQG